MFTQPKISVVTFGEKADLLFTALTQEEINIGVDDFFNTTIENSVGSFVFKKKCTQQENAVILLCPGKTENPTALLLRARELTQPFLPPVLIATTEECKLENITLFCLPKEKTFAIPLLAAIRNCASAAIIPLLDVNKSITVSIAPLFQGVVA